MVCRKIISIMSEFWSRSRRDSRGIHWRSWDQLSRPKALGGLGFRDIEAFNLALLGKQLWRMLKNKESLLTRIFRSRYFSKSDLLSAGLGSLPSYAWRSIHEAQKLIKKRARMVIESGEDTKVRQDQWLMQKPARKVLVMRCNRDPTLDFVNEDTRVIELLMNQFRDWNSHLLERIFPTEDRRIIEQVRPRGHGTRDAYVWDYTKTGHYSAKSGY